MVKIRKRKTTSKRKSAAKKTSASKPAAPRQSKRAGLAAISQCPEGCGHQRGDVSVAMCNRTACEAWREAV